jgi:hypothetical protein
MAVLSSKVGNMEDCMKKLVLPVLVLVVISPLFPQNPRIQIADHFPVNAGNTWTYADASGKATEIITIRNSMPDNVSNDGTSLYLCEREFVGIGTVSTLYSIKEDKVVILVEKNILGQYRQNDPPFPILAPAGQEWRYNDRGDDLRYKASKSSCAFDDKTFYDCIMVEERIVNGNVTLRTKKSYYANGVGLVYVTLQEPGENESVYQKLINCNFIDINDFKLSDHDGEADSDIPENNETEIVLPEDKKEEVIVKDNLDSKETTQAKIQDQERNQEASTKFAKWINGDNTGGMFIGYVYAPDLPIGVLIGGTGSRVGGYFSFSFSLQQDRPEAINNPSHIPPLDTREEHLFDMIGGFYIRIFNNFFLDLGLGFSINSIYGLFYLEGKTDPVWCYDEDDEDRASGNFVLSTGLMYSFKWFYLSAGYRQYFGESYTPSFYVGAGGTVRFK